MTRSSKLALVTLLVGLLSLASVGTVGAAAPCTDFAREHCEQMAAADDAILFRIAAIAPVHVLSGTGIGQEHFEAMTAGQFTTFGVSSPAQPVYLPGVAIEHYEQMMASSAGN